MKSDLASANNLLTPAQAAARLGISKRTLRDWRARARAADALGRAANLPYARVGGLVRYRPRDVERLIQNNLIGGRA